VTDVQNYLLNVPAVLNLAAMIVTTAWSPNNNPGSTVQVQVQYSFQFFYFFLPTPTNNLTTSSKMVISHQRALFFAIYKKLPDVKTVFRLLSERNLFSPSFQCGVLVN
jgi:hypothetical protein